MVKKIYLLILISILVLPLIYAKSVDINNDNTVNAEDVAIINNNRAPPNIYDSIYDVNNDNLIDDSDIILINSIIKNCDFLECYCTLGKCQSESNTPERCNINTVECDPDSDSDGILDADDRCDNTPGNEINLIIKDISSLYYGCSACEIDQDLDTIKDCTDICPTEYGSLDGCPSEIEVLGEDLVIPEGVTIYSSQIKNTYNNIYIYGQLDIIPYNGFTLTAANNFILNGIINANGDPGKPGKNISLIAEHFEIEGIIFDAANVVCENDKCTYSGPYTDLINKHILRQANDGGITEQCSLGQITVKACGYCGNRIKECDSGIWNSWSQCQGQGYCHPSIDIPNILLKDTHRNETSCQGAQVEYVKTLEKKECGNDCSYTNINEVDEHVAWACNTGYCGAECSSSINEECGRCGALSCQDCKLECNEPVDACTPGTKRINLGCSGSCEIKEDICSDNCGWIEGQCSEPQYESTDCNEESEIGTKKQCGYCGTQTCQKRCDFSTKKGKAVYYWSSCENEYNGDDKCLLGSSVPDKVIKERDIVCEGNLVTYQDILEKRTCSQCKIASTGTSTRATPGTTAAALKGQCGYDCDNGQAIYSGSDTGQCQKEIKECINNQWVITQNSINPSNEICNDNTDNNCDSQTDENCLNVVPPPEPLPLPNIDINDDGIINQFDFKAFYQENGKCKDTGYNARADFNNDGCVGNRDKIGGSESDDSSLFREKFPSGTDYLKFCKCPDLVKDGTIDLKDMIKIIFNYPEADLDGNGIIASMKSLGDIQCISYYFGNDNAFPYDKCGGVKPAASTPTTSTPKTTASAPKVSQITDKTAPELTYSHSPANLQSGDYVTLTATAVDPSGIIYVRFFVNGNVYSSCDNPPENTVTCSSPPFIYDSAKHSFYYVAVMDKASDVGNQIISPKTRFDGSYIDDWYIRTLS